MHEGIFQTDNVVWHGIVEPQWDEDWEEDRLSLRIVKEARKREKSKNP